MINTSAHWSRSIHFRFVGDTTCNADARRAPASDRPASNAWAVPHCSDHGTRGSLPEKFNSLISPTETVWTNCFGAGDYKYGTIAANGSLFHQWLDAGDLGR